MRFDGAHFAIRGIELAFVVAGGFLQRYAKQVCKCAIGPAISCLFISIVVEYLVEYISGTQNHKGTEQGSKKPNATENSGQSNQDYINAGVTLLLMAIRTLIDYYWVLPRRKKSEIVIARAGTLDYHAGKLSHSRQAVA